MPDAAGIGSRQYLTTRAIFSDRNADDPRVAWARSCPVMALSAFRELAAALDDQVLEQHHCPARHFPLSEVWRGRLCRRHGWDLGLARDRRPNRFHHRAGRSGRAYTAELGSMKMREEIDAIVS
jgi:hypothetical protein